ncbi:hypothetical protein A2Y83_01780 [Candidatus Falkowbacteria bacterium RBG_13_39_14]|uniref:DUF4935 domain-containing protein n=1 Tax=Candidatus Falkowbacteria bacterium RBG_13_39_14 TaxID=1797985 RepID=A0A1F5S579_9BACT|nr:MAG: hypothetical protein A2Y83_01780 [Candidatus Falkowbacteria bacterium RBG_13_39_14]
MKLIFIDTNIYLDFYRPSEHSLDILTELIKLLEDKELKLILPKQVYDEFIRNKEGICSNFVKTIHNIKDPGFVDKEKIEKVNNLVKEIKDDYEKKVFSDTSEINTKINKLFKLAEKAKETKDLLDLAYYRYLKGNPPRKSDQSYGDAIIWETLLKDYSDNDLIIVSHDRDFAVELKGPKKLHPFLEYEWQQKNNKKIFLTDTLGEVINKITKKETIKKEAIQEEKKVSADYWRKEFATMSVASGIVNNFGLGSVNYIPESSIPLQVNIDKGFAVVKVCSHCGWLIVGENSHCPICGL